VIDNPDTLDFPFPYPTIFGVRMSYWFSPTHVFDQFFS